MQCGDKLKNTRKRKILAFLSATSSLVCILSFLIWVPIFFKGKLNDLTLFAASTIFPNGSFENENSHVLKNNANEKIFIPNVIKFGGEIKKSGESWTLSWRRPSKMKC